MFNTQLSRLGYLITHLEKDIPKMTKEEFLDILKEKTFEIVDKWSEEEALLYYWALNRRRAMTMIGIEHTIARKFDALWKVLGGKK